MANVTKSEFYSTLVGVWVYIMISLGNSLRQGERRWPDILIWATAVAMVVIYAVKSMRARSETSAKSGT